MTVESGNNLGLLTLSAVVLFGGFCGFFLYAIAVSLGNILTELKSTNSLLTRFDTKLIEAEETLEGTDKATAAVEKLASATSKRQLDLSRHFSEIKNILENCENILSSVDNRIKGVNSELQKIHTQEMRGILEAIESQFDITRPTSFVSSLERQVDTMKSEFDWTHTGSFAEKLLRELSWTEKGSSVERLDSTLDQIREELVAQHLSIKNILSEFNWWEKNNQSLAKEILNRLENNK